MWVKWKLLVIFEKIFLVYKNRVGMSGQKGKEMWAGECGGGEGGQRRWDPTGTEMALVE